MSNIKKIIGVVLALVMTLSVATIAFAASGDKYSVTVTADKTELKAGETANVTVKVTANYNVSAMSIPVFFDKAKVTASAAATTIAEGAEIITDTASAADVDALYEGSGRTKDEYGMVALSYIAPYYSAIKQYNDEAVMTFTVTANDGASGAVVLECVEAAVKTSSNPSGSLYVAKNSSGSAEVDSLGEVIDDATITSATINIVGGATETPEIVANADGTGVVDASNKYLYGIEPGTADINAVFSATNNGTLRMATGYTVIGTGTVIELVSADDKVVATYTVIIFGDVNGDGAVDSVDATKVNQYALGTTSSLTGITVVAADLNADGAVDSVDATKVNQYALGTTSAISQTIGISAG